MVYLAPGVHEAARERGTFSATHLANLAATFGFVAFFAERTGFTAE
jgi:hypothetical protein